MTLLIPGVLCLAFFLNGLNDALRNSAVADEVGGHMAAGYLYWTSGRYSGGIANFPLGHLLIGLPVALLGYTYEPFTEQHLVLFRLPVLALGVLMGIVLYRFTAALAGRRAAIVALALYSLSPNIIAHSALATLDMPIAFFIFLTVFALWRYVQQPDWVRMLVLSMALACALTTKVQALLLIPVLAVVLVAYVLLSKSVRASRSWLLLLAVPWVFINLVYLNMPLRSGHVLPPLFVIALTAKLFHARHAQDAYLLGQYSSDGWWYYFPFALLVKTPAPTLILVALGLLRKHSWPSTLFMILPAAVLLGVAMATGVDIGIRHVLPVYPFLFMLAGYGAALLWQRSWRGGVLIGLGAWCACEAALIAPYHLSYFSALVGGPRDGHRLLVDSNYDWGQNDDVLRRHIAGTGLSYQVDPDPFQPTSGHILVNANALYGIYGNGRSAAYAWLKHVTPVRQIAYTWFEYDIPAEADQADPPSSELAALEHAPRSVWRTWDPGLDVPQRNAALQQVAAHLRHVKDRHADIPDQQYHLSLGVAFGAVAAYEDALDEARRLLAQDPANERALGLGGEVMVRWKLGVLNFEGEQYLHGFRDHLQHDDAAPSDIMRVAQAARLTQVSRLIAGVHIALAEALDRQERFAQAASQVAAARSFDPAIQISRRAAWQR